MKKSIPNLRHLRAFREVARCRSVSLASEKVFLSQPAITQAIVKLEEFVAAPLFERRSDGMFLTEPGTLFLNRIERVASYIRNGVREAARISGKKGVRNAANNDQLLTASQLRALVAVADTGNFSLAARSVGITQPTLHRTARDLERVLAVPMFEKTGQGIALTRAARVLAKHVKLAVAELDQGYSEIERWRGNDGGRITIGTLPLARTFLLPEAIIALSRDHPDICISVVDGPYDDLLHGLRHGDYDFLVGALRDPVPIDDVVQEPLFEDPLVIVARSGHPLAARASVTVDDMAGFPWVVPRVATPTRKQFDILFGQDTAPPPGLVETSSLILVRGLLLGSDRITIISAHQVRHEVELGLLAVLPFDMAGTARPIGLTMRRDWHPTATQEKFLRFLRDAGRSAQETL